MSDQHIVGSFDKDLEQIQGLIMRMGGLVESAIADSAKALETRDEELAEKVRAGDKQVDELQELVNEEVSLVLARRAPVASDLRIVLSVLKISGHLERSGDFAKNLAKRTGALVQMAPIEGAGGAIRRMAREVELMMKDALDAFVRRDADLARDVRHRDLDVDQMYNALFREFLTFMMEDPRNITACMHLHFIAKNVERMGDHVTSICDQVIYLSTGSYPEDERPKGDTSASFAESDD